MLTLVSHRIYSKPNLNLRNIKSNNCSNSIKHGNYQSTLAKQRNVTFLYFNNMSNPMLNKRYISKPRLPGGKTKSKVLQNIKMIKSKYPRSFYTGVTVISLSTLIYLLGIKKTLLTIGGIIALPLMFVGRHAYIHFKSRSILFNQMKKILTEKHRRDIEKHIGAFDVEKHNIKIHSREIIYDDQGRRLDSILGIINISGSHGHGMSKTMIVKRDKNWEVYLLDLEFHNYLTGQSGVDTILQPKENVDLIIDADNHSVISEVKKYSMYNLSDNNALNTPLIALTKVSSYIMKLRGKENFS